MAIADKIIEYCDRCLVEVECDGSETHYDVKGWGILCHDCWLAVTEFERGVSCE